MADLIRMGSLDAGTAHLLEAMVVAGIAIAVSGATGTGKTTLLNVLAGAIPANERVITIEDAAEPSNPWPARRPLGVQAAQRRGSRRGPAA